MEVVGHSFLLTNQDPLLICLESPLSSLRFHSKDWEEHLKSREDCEVVPLETGHPAGHNKFFALKRSPFVAANTVMSLFNVQGKLPRCWPSGQAETQGLFRCHKDPLGRYEWPVHHSRIKNKDFACAGHWLQVWLLFRRDTTRLHRGYRPPTLVILLRVSYLFCSLSLFGKTIPID